MAVKQRKQLSWFGKAALFLVLLAVPLGLGGLSVLWELLDDYQQSLPENVAQEYLSLFEQRNMEALSQYIEYTPNALEAEDSFEEVVADYFSTKDGGAGKYTLIPKVGSGSEKRYVVALDGIKVAELVLVPCEEASEHGFPLWELRDIEVTSVSGDYGVEIVAPADVRISVNGHVLGQDSMTDNAVPVAVEGYSDLPQGHGQPMYVRYEANGLLRAPLVEADAPDGGACIVELTGESGHTQRYQVTRYAGEAFAASAGVKAEFAAKLYAQFITKDASLDELVPYLLLDGSLYRHLYGFSNAWYIDHNANEFKNVELDNFILYDAAHYSCDVSFDYYIYMGKNTYEYPTAYTLYFVREGDQWKLATLEIR